MTWKNTAARYGLLSISMHWLMFVLLIAVYACIELRGNFPRGSDMRMALKTWHYMLGLSVFFLVWLRLLFRMLAPNPVIDPPLPSWQTGLSKLMYVALYLFMFGMPILGWLMLSAEGDAVPFFGMHLPSLIGPDKPFAKTLEEVHETIGNIGYFLVGIHTVAALYHHYIRRDNTVLRMLPRRK
jgi:cytochrome b561